MNKNVKSIFLVSLLLILLAGITTVSADNVSDNTILEDNTATTEVTSATTIDKDIDTTKNIKKDDSTDLNVADTSESDDSITDTNNLKKTDMSDTGENLIKNNPGNIKGYNDNYYPDEDSSYWVETIDEEKHIYVLHITEENRNPVAEGDNSIIATDLYESPVPINFTYYFECDDFVEVLHFQQGHILNIDNYDQ